MTFADISSFIAELERRQDLVRVDDALSPDLEISAVIDRACKSPGGGPALVFEKPTGATMPVAANLFGSMSRICPSPRSILLRIRNSQSHPSRHGVHLPHDSCL